MFGNTIQYNLIGVFKYFSLFFKDCIKINICRAIRLTNIITSPQGNASVLGNPGRTFTLLDTQVLEYPSQLYCTSSHNDCFEIQATY